MRIFLSASIPDPRRDERYWSTTDNVAIRDAVTALAQSVLRRDKIVFGGHPAITPIIRSVAQSLGKVESVQLYQSDWFRDMFPADNASFKDIVITERRSTRDESLDWMRERMLDVDGRISAAFFIGGMEGVEREFDFVKRLIPAVPVFPLASTGAAARILWERELASHDDPLWRRDLFSNLAFLPLFNRILTSLRRSEA